jgi:hypothetical protein
MQHDGRKRSMFNMKSEWRGKRVWVRRWVSDQGDNDEKL